MDIEDTMRDISVDISNLLDLGKSQFVIAQQFKDKNKTQLKSVMICLNYDDPAVNHQLLNTLLKEKHRLESVNINGKEKRT